MSRLPTISGNMDFDPQWLRPPGYSAKVGPFGIHPETNTESVDPIRKFVDSAPASAIFNPGILGIGKPAASEWRTAVFGVTRPYIPTIFTASMMYYVIVMIGSIVTA